MAYAIRPDDPLRAEVAPLVEMHLAEMHRFSPACHVHAMPASRLAESDISFFTIWDGDRLAGFGALREVEPSHGEIKSMRAASAYRGKGAGRALLDHLIAEARARGYSRLSLETGRTDDFRPAISLYERAGFSECEPFADYAANDFSMCMTLRL
ncbi:GNAT family N-acetyltransferase [Pacificimonas flava]|uniref:GNAT family N-acetyltransferase n=2 Tax=Pacificimonas TaxID=1960290 RepID=A0A219B9A5_9SPHN|nr:MULTISPECIES: GNAT family N-acetyltransferase [Pacificimonas]MBZ6378928.1 GNAT family N-acetyltransferase [Pacificimonas aurantium]OWV34733.1 GNAT family N-acetyltransferase [Pacificimonas flava]